MRNLIIEDFFVPITKEEINQFEKDNNLDMPNYLKEFFIIYNGASVKECIYSYKIDYLVSAFLPLLKNKIVSVENYLRLIRDDEYLIGRYDLIPFAIEGTIPFLVSIGGNDEGVVYYSAVGLDENPLRKIADSFEEFINGLHAEDE
jgi:hypothetical protein